MQRTIDVLLWLCLMSVAVGIPCCVTGEMTDNTPITQVGGILFWSGFWVAFILLFVKDSINN